MKTEELKAIQAPIKDRYKTQPGAALITLKAQGRLGEGVTCSVQTGKALATAGLHPATGGDGLSACSGDMPPSTMSWNSSGFSPFFMRLGAPQSQPIAIFTPMRSAIWKLSRCGRMIGSARSQRHGSAMRFWV